MWYAENMKCLKCGKHLDDGSKFCTGCGCRIQIDTPTIISESYNPPHSAKQAAPKEYKSPYSGGNNHVIDTLQMSTAPSYLSTRQDMNEKIKSEFKAIKSRQLIVTMPIIPIMFFLIFWGDKKPGVSIMGIQITPILLPIAFIMTIFCLIFSILYWRCPACKRYLGKQFSIKRCPKCGVELR